MAGPYPECCAVCYRYSPDPDVLKACGRCRGARYCSKECQRIDWPLHKVLCEEFVNTKNPEADKDGNIPGGDMGQFRRAIFFHPDETKPRIVWINCETPSFETWGFHLMQQGKGTIPTDVYQSDHFLPMSTPVLPPWVHDPIRGPARFANTPIANADEYQRAILLRPLQTNTEQIPINAGQAKATWFKDHDGLYITYRALWAHTKSTENLALATAVRASGNEPNSAWMGPFVFRRDSTQGNITLGDYRHLIRHLHKLPCLLSGESAPVKGGTGSWAECTLKGCPKHPRCKEEHGAFPDKAHRTGSKTKNGTK